jgi:hypothetical protein
MSIKAVEKYIHSELNQTLNTDIAYSLGLAQGLSIFYFNLVNTYDEETANKQLKNILLQNNKTSDYLREIIRIQKLKPTTDEKKETIKFIRTFLENRKENR